MIKIAKSMKTFSKIILYFVAIAALSWFLPWIYGVCTPAPATDPFLSFSPLSGKWVVSRTALNEKPVYVEAEPFSSIDYSAAGLTAAERDSLVPQLYYRQLSAHEKLPDSINGKEMSMHSLRTHEAFFNSSPRDLLKRTSGIRLMMESLPERVDLEDPKEAFRISADGIEFIDIATNKVNANRSARFTKAMKARGFQFPGKEFSANVTSRKQYDEGYMMIDSEGKAFHVKQQAGRPFVAAIKLPEGVKASHVFILEENDRSLLGLLTDTEGRLYLIDADGSLYSDRADAATGEAAGHTAIPLPQEAGAVDPEKETIVLMSNIFNRILRFTGEEGTRWRAIDASTGKLIGAIDIPREPSTARKVAKWIFPYTLTFTSLNDSLAYPRIDNFSWRALPLNVVLALILLLLPHYSNKRWGALLTLPLGIYAFIPFLLFRD